MVIMEFIISQVVKLLNENETRGKKTATVWPDWLVRPEAKHTKSEMRLRYYYPFIFAIFSLPFHG